MTMKFWSWMLATITAAITMTVGLLALVDDKVKAADESHLLLHQSEKEKDHLILQRLDRIERKQDDQFRWLRRNENR